MAFNVSYHAAGQNRQAFGAAGRMRCAITTHSTGLDRRLRFIILRFQVGWLSLAG